MPDQPIPREDPLDLDAIDRKIRVNEIKERARQDGLGNLEITDDCPPEIAGEFVRNIMAYENAPIGTPMAQLESVGIDLPDPASLDDPALTRKLWEVIHALAKLDTFLSHTDHLSDRELYEHLWHETLREFGPVIPPGSGWRHHLDILGGCSEEDIQIGLRYYDSEEQRKHWAEEWPDDPMPLHEHPPFDRDRHLPKADPPL